jgi:hypothetical protein
MNSSNLARAFAVLLLGGLAACGSDVVAPSHQPPAAINAASDLNRAAVVGSVIAKGLVVTVTDAQGRPVVDASVAFAVTAGNGTVNPAIAVTNSSGQATADWTIGTVVGTNEVTASVNGVSTQLHFDAAASAGPVASIAFTPQSARLAPTSDTLRISAQSLDQFGNPTTPAPTFVVRDPSMVTIDAGGLVHALNRGSHTYVVATAGAKRDSILVTVLAPGQSPCADAAVPLDLAVGQVVNDVSGAGFCIHASADDAQYAVVPYFNSTVPSATVPLQVLGLGVAAPPTVLANVIPEAGPRIGGPTVVPDYAFENALRARERREMATRGAAIRAARPNLIPGAPRRTVVPSVGDLVQLNSNAIAYCDNPDYRTGRVVAVTNKAIVIADTANPEGGFTDAEYRSIGVTFDTLINPTDSAAFGAVTDIDNNGHVILFFTRAVNELTSAGAGSVVLGFFYDRDLLPKTGAPGPCAGSNDGEMFYLIVPDTGGVINSNKRSKSSVVAYTNGTVAHEYQHLINASRRLYVNNANGVPEEHWLDEGLSHVAEELNFFAASGRAKRSNLIYDKSDPKFGAAFSTFEANNFLRYALYLQRTETQSPIGFDLLDDDLYTRGAIWSFLRYTADHLPADQENPFWYKLVNSTTSGVANLTNALGTAPYSLLRDWAISVYMDDIAPGVDARYEQPSWNFRSALPTYTSIPFQLITRTLNNNSPVSLTLAGNGVSFLRFTVANGQEGLVTVTSGGQPLPSTVQLSVVRVK